MPRPPISRARGGGVDLRLPAHIRDLVRGTAEQLRHLYASDAAADDPAVARLFPTPYLDDPLASLAFDDRVADGLRQGRLDAIAVVERTADARRLTADEADAWIRTLNDARVVLGTRLEVTEDSVEDDFADDPLGPVMFQHYLVLGAVVDELVRALSGG
jgi:hypothetical protein